MVLNNNKAFIRIKMVGYEDIILCFRNRNVMIYTENVHKRIVIIHKLKYNLFKRIYLVSDNNKIVKINDTLLHGRTYVCKRNPTIKVKKKNEL